MDMIAMLGGIKKPEQLMLPQGHYAPLMRNQFVAGLGAEPEEKKDDETPFYKKPMYWVGVAAVLGVGYFIWKAANPTGQEEADRLFDDAGRQSVDGLYGMISVPRLTEKRRKQSRKPRKSARRKGRK